MLLLSSNPARKSCWQQAVFPFPFVRNIKSGDECAISVFISQDRLSCELLDSSFSDPLLPERSGSANMGKEMLETTTMMADFSKAKQKGGIDTADIGTGQSRNISSASTLLEETDFLYLNDCYLEEFFYKCLLDVFQLSYKIADLTEIASVSLKLKHSFRFYYGICFYQNHDYMTIMERCCGSNKNNVFPYGSSGNSYLCLFLKFEIYTMYFKNVAKDARGCHSAIKVRWYFFISIPHKYEDEV